MHQWQRECKTLRRLRHLKGCLGRSHDSKVLHNVWMRWRTLSLFHAQLARASDLVITRRISRCLRNTFWRWEAEWEKVAVRQRAGDVSEERHCSFVIHDVFRLWAVRQKQSSRCVYVCVRAQCVCMWVYMHLHFLSFSPPHIQILVNSRKTIHGVYEPSSFFLACSGSPGTPSRILH